MAKFAPFKGRGQSVQIKIEGLDALNKSFNRLSSKSDTFMTRQIHLAASRIAKRANRDVPIDTGHLNRSINVKKRNKQAEVNVDAKYAGFVEKGTRFMKAQPYILKHVQPSLDIMMRNIKRFIKL